ALARPRFIRGTYQSPNRPSSSPVRHVQIHHRSPAGRLSRTMSRTASATAQPAVITPVTSWSFASSGGGGEGRSSCSPVSVTPSGYGVTIIRAGRLHQGPGRDVLKPRSSPPTKAIGDD